MFESVIFFLGFGAISIGLSAYLKFKFDDFPIKKRPEFLCLCGAVGLFLATMVFSDASGELKTKAFVYFGAFSSLAFFAIEKKLSAINKK